MGRINMRIKRDKKSKERENRTFRANDEEYMEIQHKAMIHCDGNVSEWLRYAGQHCVPRKAHLEPEEDDET